MSKREKKICCMSGCEFQMSAKGLCRTHYTRLRRHGNPSVRHQQGAYPRVEKSCSASGCQRKHAGLGYCDMHYQRLKTHGSPDPHLRGNEGNLSHEEYKVWVGMIQRCVNPASPAYSNYGARGITVCDRWRKFRNFLADMGCRPSSGKYTVERVNNDGNYEPTNCRWATYTEQGRNKRSNRILTIDGKTLCLTEWATVSGVNPCTIHARLRKQWPARDAVFTPPIPRSTRRWNADWRKEIGL